MLQRLHALQKQQIEESSLSSNKDVSDDNKRYFSMFSKESNSPTTSSPLTLQNNGETEGKKHVYKKVDNKKDCKKDDSKKDDIKKDDIKKDEKKKDDIKKDEKKKDEKKKDDHKTILKRVLSPSHYGDDVFHLKQKRTKYSPGGMLFIPPLLDGQRRGIKLAKGRTECCEVLLVIVSQCCDVQLVACCVCVWCQGTNLSTFDVWMNSKGSLFDDCVGVWHM